MEFLINQDEGYNLEFKESVSTFFKNRYQGRVLDQVNGTVSDTLNGTQKKILKELEKNPNITYDELVDKIDTSRRTIIRQMNDLKEKEIVKRVGPAKGGH